MLAANNGWYYPDFTYSFTVFEAACFGYSRDFSLYEPGVTYSPNLPQYYSNVVDYASENISIPTTLPPSVIEGIINHDGVSPIVISPPIDYVPEDVVDVPVDDSSDVVIDPGIPDIPEEDDSFQDKVIDGLIGISEGITSGLDRVIDNVTSNARDLFESYKEVVEEKEIARTALIEGVKIKVGEIATSISDTLNPSIEGIQTKTAEIAKSVDDFFKPPDKNIDWDKLKNIIFFDKFPFSIPKDFVYLLGLLAADPVAPKVDFDFQVDFLGGENYTKTLDLSQFNEFMKIVRAFEFVAFVIGMIYFTKNLIWK